MGLILRFASIPTPRGLHRADHSLAASMHVNVFLMPDGGTAWPTFLCIFATAVPLSALKRPALTRNAVIVGLVAHSGTTYGCSCKRICSIHAGGHGALL